VIFEGYRYAPGPASRTPKHSHEEYQFCLSLDFPGEYRYGGEGHAVPVGALSVIHPGEAHSSRDPCDRETPATYLLAYAAPGLVGRVASELAGREWGLPSFQGPIFFDRELARDFLNLHAASGSSASLLENDCRLAEVLARFVERHADTRAQFKPASRERWAVRLAKEHLEENFAASVSLEDLAALVNLSPFYLARVFSAEVGLPPHAYQTQVRVRRARDLLLRGRSVTGAAHETGFADQSHLTRHFKRLVGVPPGRYCDQNRKNVQAS